MEEYRQPDEFIDLPEECALPPDIAVTLEEDVPPVSEDGTAKAIPGTLEEAAADIAVPITREIDRKSIVRKMFAMPVASVVITLAVVFASFNFDPFGNDFLRKGAVRRVRYTASEEPKPGNAENPGGNVAPGGISATATPTPLPTATPFPTSAVPTPPGEVSGERVIRRFHVTYVPTGEYFLTAEDAADPEADAKAWVTGVGGDPDAMILVNRQYIFVKYEPSDDAIMIGDWDDIPGMYVAQGYWIAVYSETLYYEVRTEAPEQLLDRPDPMLPTLNNLAPDFAGTYAWEQTGSEEYVYIRYRGEESPTALWEGTHYHSDPSHTAPGAEYDQSTNTLTITDLDAEELNVNLMGNGFTVRLVGDNHLDRIIMWGAGYAGSVTFTGEGSLTVNNPDGIGIKVEGEWSDSGILVDGGVTLDVTGSPAILIGATSLEKAIFYVEPLHLTGGVRSAGEFFRYTRPVYDELGNVIDAVPFTLAEISEELGTQYYDHSIVDGDGAPSGHVRFAPR